ncbi:hypothetical protein M513_01626 [Trichuris suis]|uniref:protein disulfide-isomerase n=1 Tax=Trichuris suis TaxID=68888 RepID=A0A085MJX7_9BILA|nr:hypothetical protein M513_01626 [Trichuris suis]
MRWIRSSTLLFISIFAYCVSGKPNDDEYPEENGVVILNDENYDSFLESHPVALVEFFAPWCGHCMRLAPEYEKAAQRLKEIAGIPLAKLDATENPAVAKKEQIMGYPTLKFWKDGAYLHYDGDRDADGIVAWVREKADPTYRPPPDAVVTLTSENFTDVVSNAPIMLVEFYSPTCGHCMKLAPEYEKAAKSLAKRQPAIPLAKVDATKERQLATDHQVSGYPTLKVFRYGRAYEYRGGRHTDGSQLLACNVTVEKALLRNCILHGRNVIAGDTRTNGAATTKEDKE